MGSGSVALTRPWFSSSWKYTTRSAFSLSRATVNIKRGLRQGCTLAPTLYLVYKNVIVNLLRRRLGPAWLESCFTAYADDLLTLQLFMTREALVQSLQANEVVLTTLIEAGTQPNFKKTVCLLETRARPSPS